MAMRAKVKAICLLQPAEQKRATVTLHADGVASVACDGPTSLEQRLMEFDCHDYDTPRYLAMKVEETYPWHVHGLGIRSVDRQRYPWEFPWSILDFGC